MMSISYVSIALGLLLLAVPGCLVFLLDRTSIPRVLMAFARMVVQLALLGLCVWGLYKFDSVWLNLLGLLLLSTVSSVVVVQRAHLRPGLMLLPVTAAHLLSVAVVGAWLLLIVLKPERPLSAQSMVPVMGVLAAHIIPAGIRALSTFYESLRGQSQPYRVQVGNGVGHWRSLRPYLRQSLLAITGPMVSSLSVIGLFALPLLFSGQLLGGVPPLQAAAVVGVLTAGCIAASLLFVLLALLFADRKVFDRRGNYTDVKWEIEKMKE